MRAVLLHAQEFKAGKSPIMLATDVAARGLGMQTPSWVSQTALFMRILTTREGHVWKKS
jgi:superfamily II DNA/RNA helicase